MAEREGLRDGVVAVLLNSCDDEGGFLLVEEAQREGALVRGFLGEVGDGEDAYPAGYDGEQSLHDEDPSPACNARQNARSESWVLLRGSIMLAKGWTEVTKPTHVREPVREDAGEGGRHGADQVEDCVALLEVIAWIPAGEEVGTALNIDILETVSFFWSIRGSWTHRKEARFKDTEHHAEADHLVPPRKGNQNHCPRRPRNVDW